MPATGSILAARFDLPLGPRAASLARSATRDVLRLWDVSDAADDALLVVSELVGNAVRQGADHVLLVLEAHADLLLIAVEDGSAVLPRPSELDFDAESGRGMLIVDALSQRWGVSEKAPGKRIWAELATPCSAEPALPQPRHAHGPGRDADVAA